MNEKEILSFWNIPFAGTGDHSLITGSPNRTERRFLFRDDKENFYIAEGYNLNKRFSQIRQNLLLEFFAENTLSAVYPFFRTLSGSHGEIINGLFWQIRPYIPAENISRFTLGTREDYGVLWGNFLLQMKEVLQRAENLPAMPNSDFYMSDFLPELMKFAQQKMPFITGKLREFERSLAPFFKWERKAGSMFAHGDFHPGNILMEKGKIKVVIDWEFAGMKFPGYDMALLIGCLAMDHPDNLSSPVVRALQDTLYKNSFMPDEAWEHLSEMIAATRMGWLGEWLLLDDEELVRQELELISILLG